MKKGPNFGMTGEGRQVDMVGYITGLGYSAYTFFYTLI